MMGQKKLEVKSFEEIENDQLLDYYELTPEERLNITRELSRRFRSDFPDPDPQEAFILRKKSTWQNIKKKLLSLF